MGAELGWLFETSALKIAPADKPFFYTSGLIGPYYINTHFLCGGEKRAEEILKFIDQKQEPRNSFPALLEAELEGVSRGFKIYAQTIEAFCECIRSRIGVANIDFVSGGQRRDWFFAPLVAKQLNIPCLYIYTDLGIIDRSGTPVQNIAGARVLNVADLLTVASSYTGKWIPALERIGGKLLWSVNGVDRQQGGKEILEKAGLMGCFSLFSIDRSLFEQALGLGYINKQQFELVEEYLRDPFESMRNFIIKNRSFLENALKSSDQKLKSRAELMNRENLYKL